MQPLLIHFIKKFEDVYLFQLKYLQVYKRML